MDTASLHIITFQSEAGSWMYVALPLRSRMRAQQWVNSLTLIVNGVDFLYRKIEVQIARE